MTGDFRKEVKQTLKRLLDYWHTIEVWLKKSEQISSAVVIPAINELRYASRQLYNAVRIYGKYRLTPGDRSALSRRLILAEQYLLNADHDIGDAITTFYRTEVEAVRSEFTAPLMRQYFPEFDRFCTLVATCDELILNSRYDYDARAANYRKIRELHVDELKDLYPKLVDAHALARYEKQKLEIELARARDRANILTWFGATAGVIAIVGTAFSIYAWFEPVAVFCRSHANDAIAQLCAPSLGDTNGVRRDGSSPSSSQPSG